MTDKQQLEFNQSKIGKNLEVLFDRKTEKQAIGRTEYMQVVYDNNLSLYGKMVMMKITEAHQNTLKGELV